MKSPKEAEKVFLIIVYALMVFKRYLDISKEIFWEYFPHTQNNDLRF